MQSAATSSEKANSMELAFLARRQQIEESYPTIINLLDLYQVVSECFSFSPPSSFPGGLKGRCLRLRTREIARGDGPSEPIPTTLGYLPNPW